MDNVYFSINGKVDVIEFGCNVTDGDATDPSSSLGLSCDFNG